MKLSRGKERVEEESDWTFHHEDARLPHETSKGEDILPEETSD